MGDGNLKSYTVTNAKETNKKTRFRRFTESELYRPFSQIYDSVEAQTTSKRIHSWGWALLSNGITHLIASSTADINGKSLWIIKDFGVFYPRISVAFIVAGIVLIILSSIQRYKPIKKEALIQKYLDQEFADDEELTAADVQFADSFKDNGLIMDNHLSVPLQHQPKHKAQEDHTNKTVKH